MGAQSMNNKKLKIFVTAAVLSLMAAAAITFGVPPKTVSAQAGPFFTMTGAFNGVSVPNGVVIVNQTTGAVSVCNQQAFAAPNSPTSNETCEFRGRAIPGSGTSSLTVTAAYGSVFILNNQSGLLLECTTSGKANCVSHGILIR
jgi:hypothetical protein